MFSKPASMSCSRICNVSIDWHARNSTQDPEDIYLKPDLRIGALLIIRAAEGAWTMKYGNKWDFKILD
jgi:hypothetical protein